MNNMRQPVIVPQTEDEWRRGLISFFIKLPAGGIPLLGRIFQPERYISIKRNERVTQSTKSDNVPSPVTTSKYSTASCATLDMEGNIKLFYFTPVVRVQSNSSALVVTISRGPPPPPSRIKSNSASGGDEVIREQQEDDDDNDVRLKQAFIELVGREYVFPLPVRAVDIPDTHT
jgi:hypothetical protein